MKFPRNATVLLAVFVTALVVAWLGGLGWWSVFVAALGALLLTELYHRLTRSRRVAPTEPNEELAVLYFDKVLGWRLLVGGESCSRGEAEVTRRELEKLGYRVKVIPLAELPQEED